jgi:hypothetical protein
MLIVLSGPPLLAGLFLLLNWFLGILLFGALGGQSAKMQ